eukprot:9820775-Ditylum_brightwellii.AAC.1
MAIQTISNVRYVSLIARWVREAHQTTTKISQIHPMERDNSALIQATTSPKEILPAPLSEKTSLHIVPKNQVQDKAERKRFKPMYTRESIHR